MASTESSALLRNGTSKEKPPNSNFVDGFRVERIFSRRHSFMRSVMVAGVLLISCIPLIYFFGLLKANVKDKKNLTTSSITDASAVDPRFAFASDQITTVAFIGNSMFFFNDFPRFFQTLSQKNHRPVYQNSCLRGSASIPSLLAEGNGMWPQFGTPEAIIFEENGVTIHDYGACTVQQLLLGVDDRLVDPGYAVTQNVTSFNKNPCRQDLEYLKYTQGKAPVLPESPVATLSLKTQSYGIYINPSIETSERYTTDEPKNWDFVLINDNTRNPARQSTRARSLQILELFHLPWILATNSTPVFLWTHAYSVTSTESRNMTGMDDVANFTSLTLAGLKEYVRMLRPHLPETNQPRIAPSGLAWLLVYEEDPVLWKSLFHQADFIHASPSGSLLQGLTVYHTLFGELPSKDSIVNGTESLWSNVRMMQHAWEPPNPYPTPEVAAYLYDVAQRVCVDGVKPATFINYHNGEAAYEG